MLGFQQKLKNKLKEDNMPTNCTGCFNLYRRKQLKVIYVLNKFKTAKKFNLVCPECLKGFTRMRKIKKLKKSLGRKWRTVKQRRCKHGI